MNGTEHPHDGGSGGTPPAPARPPQASDAASPQVTAVPAPDSAQAGTARPAGQEGLGGQEWPPVSVVMPVLNEERHLRAAVAQVIGQDYPGDIEVVIALGPSRDATDAIAAELAAADPRVRTVPNPSGRTPCALNAAIAASRHPVLVRVDGHGMLPPDYVRTAVRLLRETGAANVGGIMHAEGTTPFERAVAAAMTSPLGVGNARFHTGGGAGPADTVYLGVFRREVLERLGGYDESFDRAQDWELNYRIRQDGGLVWFSPELQVSYRPRPTVRALARQYFHYGRWRRVVARQHPGSVNLRYLAPPTALVASVAGLVVGGFFPVAYAVPGAYVLGVLGASVWLGRRDRDVLVRLPLVLPTMHFAWGWGFLTSPQRLARQARASAQARAAAPGPGQAQGPDVASGSVQRTAGPSTPVGEAAAP